MAVTVSIVTRNKRTNKTREEEEATPEEMDHLKDY